MKNWKSIFMALAAVLAGSIAYAQDAAPAAPANDANKIEMKTRHGFIKAEKVEEDGQMTVKISVSGLHTLSSIYAIMDDIQKIKADLVAGKMVGKSAPREEGAPDLGGVKGKHGMILANKEVSNGKVTIDAVVHSIPAEVTAAELATDFLHVIAQMVVDDQILFAGKTLILNVTFKAGQDVSVFFQIDAPIVNPEAAGAPGDMPDNSILVDDRNVSGV